MINLKCFYGKMVTINRNFLDVSGKISLSVKNEMLKTFKIINKILDLVDRNITHAVDFMQFLIVFLPNQTHHVCVKVSRVLKITAFITFSLQSAFLNCILVKFSFEL